MAVRLSVVMVHTPPAGARAQRKGEEVVGELIGSAGIDLTLVASFQGLQRESTDHLSLASLTGDVAVLDWQTPEMLIQALNAIGIPGTRSPHPNDREVPVPALDQRRVYAFDLNEFPSGKDVVAALRDLKAQREVRTFSLDSLLPAPATKESPLDAAGPSVVAPKAQESGDESADVRTSQVEMEPQSGAARPDGARRGPGAPSSRSSIADSDRRPPSLPGLVDLDDLLDQLDELDP